MTLFWFPPFGLMALYNVIKADRYLNRGMEIKALKRRVKARNWLRFGLLGGMTWFIGLAAYVFIKGGEVIPVLGAFY